MLRGVSVVPTSDVGMYNTLSALDFNKSPSDTTECLISKAYDAGKAWFESRRGIT